MSNKYDKVSTDDADEEPTEPITDKTGLNNNSGDGENDTDITQAPIRKTSKTKTIMWIIAIALVIAIILIIVLTTQYRLPDEENPIVPQEPSLAK